MAEWWEKYPVASEVKAGANWWDKYSIAGETEGADAPIVDAAAVPAEEDTWMSRVMSGAEVGVGMFDKAGRGIARGVMNMAGAPADLINIAPMAANLIPGVDGVGPLMDEPYFGSTRLKRGLDELNTSTANLFGVEPPVAESRNIGERFTERIGEEIGAAGTVVGGITAKATSMGVDAARNSGRISRMFLEPAAIDPARFAGRELAAATAAGQGAAAANEVYPDSALADIAGAIAGGLGYGVAGHVGSKALDVANAVRGSPNYADKVVRESVTDMLAQDAGLQAPPGGEINTDELVAAIAGGPRVAAAIPGFSESLADRTGNAGLAAREYSRQSGPNAGTFTQRRADNTTAIDAAMGRSEPSGQPGTFRTALEDARDNRIGGANLAARQAREAAEVAVAPITPRTTSAERGDVVRSALDDAREAARERTAGAYDAADVSGREIDPTDLRASLENVTVNLTETERGLVPQGLIDRVAALGRVVDSEPEATGILDSGGQPIMREPEAPEPVVMKEATDLKSELQRLQRAANADPRAERGGRNAARVLGRYIDAVDNFINSSITPEEQAALQTARGTKFEEAEAFTRAGDPVAGALSAYEGGRPRMRDERVAGSFVDPHNMARLFTQADTPEVRAAIRDELLSRADTSSPEGIQQFTTTYGEQLNNFPGLRQELDNAVRARVSEATATSAEAGLVADIGLQGKGVVAKYLQYGNEYAERAMKAVMAHKEPSRAIDELLTFVEDDPAAVEGARKVFWDILQKSSRSAGETTATVSGSQPWMPKALKRFIDDPAKQAVAERLWRDNPEHLENVRRIADALQNVDIRARAKAPNTSGTAQGVNPLLTPEAAQSRIYAYRSKRISGTFLLTSIAAVTGRRAVRKAQSSAIERMLDEALNNPEVAAQLLKENNPANRAAMRRKAKTWFGNEASTILGMFEDEEDETVRAAMENSDGR